MIPSAVIRTFCAALVAATALTGAERANAKSWIVTGAGYGHGIGMSQFGAYGFAKHGFGYREILGHYYTGTAIAQTSGKTIRVILAAGRRSVGVRGASSANGEQLDPARTYRAVRSGNSIRLLSGDGKRQGSFDSPLRLTGQYPKTLLGSAINGVTDGRYRGALDIRTAGSGGLNAINAVALEDYVAGVISAESPASWPPETLKAQAVAARSYAIATNVNGPGFDQYPDTRSQMYVGVNGETPSTNKATGATANEVVSYNDRPVPTFFFSTSGGQTENIENVFLGSDPKPYLKGVDDPYDATSPYHRWGPIHYTNAQLGAKLGAPGKLREVQVVKHGVSPRIVRANIVGSRGTRALTGPQIQSRLGLRSTWIDFRRPGQKEQQPPSDQPTQPPDNGGSPAG